MRHVYFSFHYADIWKVNQIRNSGIVFGAKSVGFVDRSLWEEAKLKNRAALEKLIEEALVGTSVTAVLIGRETAERPWVRHEIERSVACGSALVGIHLNRLKDQKGRRARRGALPALLREHNAPVYEWTNARDLGQWVEAAWQANNPDPSPWSRFVRWLER